MSRKNVPLPLYPFAIVWDLLTFILNVTGRILAVILSLLLMAVGIALTMTIAAAPIGIPLVILGFLLMIRSVF